VNVPKFDSPKNRERGHSMFLANENGSVVTSWQDTKTVLAISNCHEASCSDIVRKRKDG